jgi:hypothetical protein
VLAAGDVAADHQEWNFMNESRASYPFSVTIVEGDEFCIPLLDWKQSDLMLYQVANGSELSLRCVPFTIEDGVLVISNLEAGSYRLLFKREYLTTNIEVVKGSYWKDTKLIVTRDKLLETRGERKHLAITALSTEEVEQEVVIKAEI